MFKTRRKATLYIVLASLTICASGCSNSNAAPRVNVSNECQAAVTAQASIWMDQTTSDAQVAEADIASLNACKDLDEWATAVSREPNALGSTGLDVEQAADEVHLVCLNDDPNNTSPVCTDAASRGYLE